MPLSFNLLKNKNGTLHKGFYYALFLCFFVIFSFLPKYALALPSCSSSPFYSALMPDSGNNCGIQNQYDDISTLKSCSDSSIKTGTSEDGSNIYINDAILENITCKLTIGNSIAKNCETLENEKPVPGQNCMGYLPYCNNLKDGDGSYKYAGVVEGQNCNVLPYCHNQEALKRKNVCDKINAATSNGDIDPDSDFDYDNCLYSTNFIDSNSGIVDFNLICEEYYNDEGAETEGENTNRKENCLDYIGEYIDPIPGTNCELKSCVHLTGKEFYDSNGHYSTETLYSPEEIACANNCDEQDAVCISSCGIDLDKEQRVADEMVRRSNNKYCDPYVYKTINGKFTKTNEQLHCNSIKYERLSYVKASSGEMTQCFLHRCPLQDYNSITCPTDVVNINNVFHLKWRDSDYETLYKNKILNNVDLDKRCLMSQCDVAKIKTNLSCGGSNSPIPECDRCFGIDNNAVSSDSDCIKYNAEIQNVCDSGYCVQTTDCAFSPNNSFCTDIDEEESEPSTTINIQDDYQSWFYRPEPAQESLYKRSADGMEANYQNTRFVPFAKNRDKVCRSKNDYLNNYRTQNQQVCIPILGWFARLFGNFGCTNAGRCTNAGCFGAGVASAFSLGTYTLGDVNHTKAKSSDAVFSDMASPGLCDVGYPTTNFTRAIGRGGICDSRFIWDTPDMEKAAYLSGDISVNYQDKDGKPIKSPSDATYALKACVRYHNSMSLETLDTCGERLCKIDCFSDLCEIQYCGYDQCKILEVSRDMNCDVENPDSKCSSYPATYWGPEDKKVRVRAKVYGNRVCVFLDLNSSGILSSEDLYSQPRRSGEGYLDLYSLLDDDSRESTSCPPGVESCSRKSDSEVFGENLFATTITFKSGLKETFKCPETVEDFKDNMLNNGEKVIKNKISYLQNKGIDDDEIEANIEKFKAHLQKCKELSINNGVNDFGSGDNILLGIFKKATWYPIDLIQYIGNNQPDGYPRGYYDADGVFYPEQQCFKVPLAAGPPRFYKYTTVINTPKLFIPSMYIDGVVKNCISKTSKNECESAEIGNIEDTLANFIDPGVVVKFGNNKSVPFIPFGNLKEPAGEGEDAYKTIDALDKDRNKSNYFLEKTYENDGAKICLKQLGFTNTGSVDIRVGCVSRQKPVGSNIIILNGKGSEYNDGKLQAILTRGSVNNEMCSSNYGNKCIKLNENSSNINGVDYVKVTSEVNEEFPGDISVGNMGFGDGYPIKVGYSNADCSALFNECITNRVNLFNESTKEDKNEIQLDLYKDFDEKCKNKIEKKCNLLKSEENAYGYYYEACINEGFDQILDEVISYDYGISGPMGKCVLDDESRMNSDCRLKIYNEEFKNICECSGDDCKELPSKCYSGGYNGYGISYTNAVDGLGDGEYVQANICRCAKVGDDLPVGVKDFNVQLKTGHDIEGNLLVSRTETRREAGLCVDIPNKVTCDEISYGVNNDSSDSNYTDRNGKYRGLFWENDAGKPVNKIHESHIRRTRQIQNKYPIDIPKFDNTNDKYIKNVGHADFQVSVEGMSDSTLEGVPGSCNGFWRENFDLEAKNRTPNAICQKISSSTAEGEYINFKNSCERYKCPEILSKENNNSTEYKTEYLGGIVYENDEEKGKNNGYAEWPEFDINKIDTYEDDNDGSGLAEGDKDLDGYPDIDDIHIVKASRCIDGYGPNGANERLANYMGDVIDEVNGDLKDTLYDIDDIVTSAPLVYLEKSQNELNDYANVLLGYKKSQDYGLSLNFINQLPNLANERLPKRYCNQIGEWEIVLNKDGIQNFSSYNVATDTHYINYKCLNSNLKDTKCIGINEGYQDAESRFCERLYCPEKGLADVENDVNVDKAKNFWERTGGATWEQVNASRFRGGLSEKTYGTCDITKNYYPRNTQFLKDVGDQQRILQCNNSSSNPYENSCESELTLYNQFISDMNKGISTTKLIMNSNSYSPNSLSGIPNLIKEFIAERKNGINSEKDEEFDFQDLLVVEGSVQTQPSRYCNHIGLWSPIILPCVKSCPYIGKGSESTGGARWKKVLTTEEPSKAGETLNTYKEYKCTKNSDGSVTNCKEFNFASIDGDLGANVAYAVRGQCDPIPSNPLEGYVQSSDGAPLRVCKSDGTWGEVIRPCILSKPCVTTTFEDSFKGNNGYAIWDTGNSFSVSGTEGAAIVSIEEECLEGFWVDANNDGVKQLDENSTKLIRKCDTRVDSTRTEGLWLDIEGFKKQGDSQIYSTQKVCKMLTCTGNADVDNIYQPAKGYYYVKMILDRYSSYMSDSNLASYFGYKIKNDETINCNIDTNRSDFQGNSTTDQDCWTEGGKVICKGNDNYAQCVKNINNYNKGIFEENYKINTKKICKLGYLSPNLEMVCNKKTEGGIDSGEWDVTGDLCQVNKCQAFTDNNDSIYWPESYASVDLDGNGAIDSINSNGKDERAIAVGTCDGGKAGSPKRECLPDGTWGPTYYDKNSDKCSLSCFKNNADIDSDGTVDLYGIPNNTYASFDNFTEWQIDGQGRKFVDSDTKIYGVCNAGYGNNYSLNNGVRTVEEPSITCGSNGIWQVNNPCEAWRNCASNDVMGSVVVAINSNSTSHFAVVTRMSVSNFANGLSFVYTACATIEYNFGLGNKYCIPQSMNGVVSCDDGKINVIKKGYSDWRCINSGCLDLTMGGRSAIGIDIDNQKQFFMEGSNKTGTFSHTINNGTKVNFDYKTLQAW